MKESLAFMPKHNGDKGEQSSGESRKANGTTKNDQIVFQTKVVEARHPLLLLSRIFSV
jgi:hypothetical protein